MPLDLGQQRDAIQEENTITIFLIHEGAKKQRGDIYILGQIYYQLLLP